MICDVCKKNEAIISYTKLNGKDVEIGHLCAACAEKKMKEDMVFNQGVKKQMESFLGDLFKLTGKQDNNFSKKKCAYCGTTFEGLNNNNLGCEHCYDEFREEIKAMLLSLKSKAKHKGKIPVSAGKDCVMKREEEELLNKLSVAIELEEYENAAILRDKLKAVREKSE